MTLRDLPIINILHEIYYALYRKRKKISNAFSLHAQLKLCIGSNCMYNTKIALWAI